MSVSLLYIGFSPVDAFHQKSEGSQIPSLPVTREKECQTALHSLTDRKLINKVLRMQVIEISSNASSPSSWC
jgi:hypothetical protein